MCWKSLFVKWLCFDSWKPSYLAWGCGLLVQSMSTKSLFVQTDHNFGWHRYEFLDLLDLQLTRRNIVILCILTWNWNVHRNRYALLVVYVELTSVGVMESLWSLPKPDGSRNRCVREWNLLPSKSSFICCKFRHYFYQELTYVGIEVPGIHVTYNGNILT